MGRGAVATAARRRSKSPPGRRFRKSRERGGGRGEGSGEREDQKQEGAAEQDEPWGPLGGRRPHAGADSEVHSCGKEPRDREVRRNGSAGAARGGDNAEHTVTIGEVARGG